MRTTVTLDEDVAAALDRDMRSSGRSFRETLNARLRESLARRTEVAAIAPFVVRARAMGAIPGLDYSNTEELLEVAEGPGHR